MRILLSTCWSKFCVWPASAYRQAGVQLDPARDHCRFCSSPSRGSSKVRPRKAGRGGSVQGQPRLRASFLARDVARIPGKAFSWSPPPCFSQGLWCLSFLLHSIVDLLLPLCCPEVEPGLGPIFSPIELRPLLSRSQCCNSGTLRTCKG